MTSLTVRHALVLVPALLLLPQLLQAQAEPDHVKRRKNCRLATQVIETGHLAPKIAWAWQYIGVCEPSEQVQALNAAIQQARHSNDPAVAERALMRVVFLRDGVLFNEVMNIADDPAASTPARVVALMALAAIRNPQVAPFFAGFVGGLDEYGLPRGGCSKRRMHVPPYVEGPNPMPTDYVQQILSLREKLRLSTTAPADVSSAAACV